METTINDLCIEIARLTEENERLRQDLAEVTEMALLGSMQLALRSKINGRLIPSHPKYNREVREYLKAAGLPYDHISENCNGGPACSCKQS